MDNTGREAQSFSADATTAQSVGATLAAARIARGASVEDVSRLLKLSVAQVNAIEADDYSQLPSAVFARGFVRNYARLLHVDIAPILPALPAAAEKPDERLMHRRPGVLLEPRRSQKLPAVVASVTAALLGFAYYEFSLNAPAVSPYVAATTSVATATQQSRAAATTMDQAVDEPSAVVADATEQPPMPVADNNLRLKTSSDPASGVGEKGLHFLFNGESWVEVRGRDGKVVFSMVNAPGSERIVRGDPPFSLVIGGASGVQLSYNGSRVDLASYVTSDVARLRLE